MECVSIGGALSHPISILLQPQTLQNLTFSNSLFRFSDNLFLCRIDGEERENAWLYAYVLG